MRHRPALLALLVALSLAACNRTGTQDAGLNQQPTLEQPGGENPGGEQPGTNNPGDGGTQQPPSGGSPNPGSGTTQPGGPSGTLDESFGDGGVASLNSSQGSTPFLEELAVQTDGKIVVLARTGLLRFNGDGARDESFGTNGTRPVDTATELALFPDDRIVVAGYSAPVLAFTPSGQPDPSFGSAGSIQPEGNASDVAVRDGKLYVLSETFEPHVVVVTRFTANGQADASFGTNGRVALSGSYENTSGDVRRGNFPAAAIVPTADGHIYLVGRCSVAQAADNSYPNGAMCVSRLSASGQLDTTFGNLDGVAAYIIDKYTFATSLGLLPDGRLLVSGSTDFSGVSWAVIRLTADGKSSERLDAPYTRSPDRRGPSAVLVDAQGRAYLPGTFQVGGPTDWKQRLGLLRFTADGQPDESFAPGGMLDPLPVDTPGAAQAAAFTRDGAIIVGGNTFNDDGYNLKALVLVKVWQ
jgi:uncharacterized delta-60 repeat protein